MKRVFEAFLIAMIAKTGLGGFWSNSAEDLKSNEELYPTDYGVDVSFPIHGYIKKDTIFKRRYEASMAGCYAKYSQRECDGNERARIEMNREQPKTQHNYTEIGFKKLRVPSNVWEPLMKFYNQNKGNEKTENWPRGNTYTNHWDAPTYMLNFEDGKLRGGRGVKQQIWDGMRPILEEWTGHELTESSLYGIRIYKDGAMLATHVDRMPLVSSAIIQVDQDIDEPWPVEVYSHDGQAHNVSMLPGDCVLYESHTVLHGRPFPLKGKFYANVFVHFIPVDHEEVQEHDKEERQGSGGLSAFFKGVKTVVGGHEHDNHDEEAVQRHIKKIEEEGEEFEEEIEEAKERGGDEESLGDGRTALHVAAGRGNLEEVERLLGNQHTDLLSARDANDWQAIHEAVRGGHLDVLRYLVDMGADIAAKTSNGGTVLWWAKRKLEPGHDVILYLEEIGAPEEGEDL